MGDSHTLIPLIYFFDISKNRVDPDIPESTFPAADFPFFDISKNGKYEEIVSDLCAPVVPQDFLSILFDISKNRQ